MRALAEHQGIHLAAGPEEAPNPFSEGRGLAMPTKRQIPKDHSFDPKSLKPLVKTLWALSVSLGHALTAHRQFSRLKSIGFSPDGLVGGRGYVMGVKDVRKALHEATENISTICDTIYDEINAPHWKPKLGELEKDDEEFVKLLDDAKGYMSDPEGEAEEDMEEVESKPSSWSRFKKDEDQTGSKLPNGGDIGNESQGPHPANVERREMKQASHYRYDRTATSSVAPGELPGPRVEHLDPGDRPGPEGSYNRDEPLVDDQWGRDEGVGHEYAYRSEWDNNLSERTAVPQAPVAESGLPNDSKTVEPKGYDFGIGDGNGNDAHGQGSQYPNPDGSGASGTVYGPRAELPGTPAGKTPGTGLEGVEQSGNMGIPVVAKLLTHADLEAFMSAGKLPNDDEPPVARSDYYRGPKGNDNVVGEAELPEDGSGGTYDAEKDLPNEAVKVEQVTEPYIKWDDDTHNMRPDYIYQRDPIQGPYVKQG